MSGSINSTKRDEAIFFLINTNLDSLAHSLSSRINVQKSRYRKADKGSEKIRVVIEGKYGIEIVCEAEERKII